MRIPDALTATARTQNTRARLCRAYQSVFCRYDKRLCELFVRILDVAYLRSLSRFSGATRLACWRWRPRHRELCPSPQTNRAPGFQYHPLKIVWARRPNQHARRVRSPDTTDHICGRCDRKPESTFVRQKTGQLLFQLIDSLALGGGHRYHIDFSKPAPNLRQVFFGAG